MQDRNGEKNFREQKAIYIVQISGGAEMIFYESFWDAAKCLPHADRLATIEAIVAYGCEGIIPNLTGAPMAVFLMAKPLIDANAERKANGSKGGRPRKEEKTENPTQRTAGKFINFKQSDTDWNDVADQIKAAQ